jgi:hypothetical protein
VAAGGAPAATVAVSLRGWAARGCWRQKGGLRSGCGVTAEVMAASTSGRHKMRLRDPGGRPLGLVSFMLMVGVGEPGALGGGGFGGPL